MKALLAHSAYSAYGGPHVKRGRRAASQQRHLLNWHADADGKQGFRSPIAELRAG